ncbi:GNAT family N-acetyltransferase [Kineococcus sp. TBRC 1896]|uniref:GNAT family N-acetyltransferase n=1 Tax=Kineococcus mangrovi TaxID=1660183 RepID=A0ABV4HZ78_9ACTN
MPGTPTYRWRGALTDADLLDLVASHGGRPAPGWWPRVREHSLGWVTAHDDLLVGFVNVAWDGGDHAFLLDTGTRPSHQRRGIGTALVQRAVREATAAGCEWLHVDFLPELTSFYRDACGFRPTEAGLVHLSRGRPREDGSDPTPP